MLVKFKNAWFGPTEIVVKDAIQHISGRYYKKGVNDVDKSLKGHLPTDTILLDKGHGEIKEEEPKKAETLRDFDMERSASDAFGKMAKEADTQYEENLKKKQDRMAHARSSKGAKKGDKVVK